jgi:hypothetical protein
VSGINVVANEKDLNTLADGLVIDRLNLDKGSNKFAKIAGRENSPFIKKR